MKKLLCLIVTLLLLLSGCGNEGAETTAPTVTDLIPETTALSNEENQLMLEQEAQILEDKYGVAILVGDQCETVFSQFTASYATDYEKVSGILETLDYILGRYPEGFFRQLCTEERSGIRIHLIQDLWANNEDLYGGDYGGFSQDLLDHYILVLDVDATWEELYYHELTHIIDMHIAMDAAKREDALFSEEGWSAMNPEWFPGYADDYMNLPDLQEDGWFVDPYGAINPQEDRAQVMAKAMLPNYRIYFNNNQGIRMKMEYYSLVIQDVFDTTGWPEILPWEENYRN